MNNNYSSLKRKGSLFKRFFLSLIVFLGVLTTHVNAQSTANYAFTTNTTGSLALDMNGNTVDMSTGTTQVLTTNTSQDQSINATAITFPAGFQFRFGGNLFTSYFATSNGVVQLGGTAVISGSTYSAGGGTLTAPRFSAFDGDLGTGTTGGIFGKIFGTGPNRCYVIEFRNMNLMWNTYTNDGTYQVRFYETTGVVEYVYGTMFCNTTASSADATPEVGFSWGSSANQSFSVNIGTSATDISGTMIQNTVTAGTNITNLNSAADGSRRVYRFTPPVPNSPTSLTFSGVGAFGMTLNWVDNATNELGYQILRSLDGITYTSIATIAPNSTSYNASSLSNSTNYFWKVVAYTEGANNTPDVAGSQMTLASGTLTGIKTVGAGGDYNNLTIAFNTINAQGLAGDVDLQLITGYPATPETYPIQSSNTAAVGAFNVKVYPMVSGLSITSANTTGTLNLNNAKNLTFDGRVNQTGANDLVIANTNAGTSYAVLFNNDSQNNTIKNAFVQSTNTSTTSGTIVFGTTTGTNGNDNNTIDNCDIRDGATTPTNGIYAAGTTTTATHFNDNITISNNRISNFFSAGSTSVGVLVGTGNSTWTITNNKVFQTATRTYTTGNTHNGIQVSHTNGNGFVVTNNIIGFASAAGTGTYTMAGGVTNRFIGINISAGTTTPSSVQGNTVTAINLSTTSGAAATNGVLAGINVTAGNVNVGNITPNVIGGTTGNDAIVSTASTAGALVVGINSSSAGTVNIVNNLIGSLTANGSTATTPGSITGIQVSAGTPTITGNTIGSTTTANSFNGSVASTGGAQLIRGIDITGGSAVALIQNNTISNLTQSGTSATANIRGIAYGGTGNATINQNTISNLIGANSNATIALTASNGPSVAGIVHYGASTTGSTISNNTIQNISATNATAVQTNVVGIAYGAVTSGSVTKNKIYDLRNASTMAVVTTPPVAAGILLRTVTTGVNVNNNMISLGDAQTTNTQFVGVWSQQNSNGINVYYNSISITGTAASGALPSFGFLRGDNSGTAVTATIDFRNNIISNQRAGGTGKHYAIANQSTAPSATGWALNASNNNALVTANTATVGLWGSTDAGFNAWRIASNGDANSFSGIPVTFVNVPNGDLHLNMGVTATPLESGGATIASVTTDYDLQTRPGPVGPVNGGGTSPDVGADEFDGAPALPVITLNSVTPPTTTQCVAAARLVSVNVTTPVGTVVQVQIGYTVNGVPQSAIVMTNTSGTTWQGTIPAPTPANAVIAWGVSATNSVPLTSGYTGTPYNDEPLFGMTSSATNSASTVCAGSPSTLTAKLVGNGTAQLGAATTTTALTAQPTAFCNRWSSYRMQTVYTAAELNAAGLQAGPITAITFNIISLGSAATNNNFTVKAGTTALTAFTDFISSASFTTVFPAATYTHAIGANTITFSTPYNWDGTSNLVIEVSHDGANSTNNAETYYTATPGNTVAWSTNGTATGTPSPNRLNIIFTGKTLQTISSIAWSDGVGTVGTTNPLAVSPTTTTTYTANMIASGCPVTPAPTTTVTVNPLPTAPTTTNSAQCGVQVPTASVASTSGLPTPTFKWYTVSSGGSAVQTSTSTTYTSTVGVTTTFYVSEMNSVTGCESPRTAVTVNVSTPDPINVVSSVPSICLGQSFTLTGSNASGTPFQTYTYSFQSVTTGSGAETPVAGNPGTITPTASGTFIYTATGVDGGCAATNTVSVQVKALPAITATATPATVCSGDAIALSATVNDFATGANVNIGTQTTTEFGGGVYRNGFGTGDFRHQLIFTAAELTAAGVQPGNITALKFYVTTVGSGSANNYTIRMGNTAATAATTTFLTDPTAVVYTAATYTAVNGTNTHTFGTPFNWNGTSNVLIDICYNISAIGTSSTLAATTPASARNSNLLGSVGACTALTGTTYANRPLVGFTGNVYTNVTASSTLAWTPGGFTTATASTSIANNTGSPITQAYSVMVTNPATGCSNTMSTAAVTINPATVAPTANNSTQCGTGVPTASVTGSGTPGNTFQWYTVPTGGTAISGQTGSSLSAYPVSTTTTFYVSESNGTCSSPRTAVTVTVTTPPSVSIAGSPTLCIGSADALTASSSNDPNYTYTWSGGLGTGATVSASPTVTTTYTVSASDVSGGANNGCNTTATFTVTVNPVPTGVTASVSDNLICNGEAVTLTSGPNSVPVALLTQNFNAGLGTWTTAYSGTAPVATQWLIQNSPYTIDGSMDFTNFSTPNGGGFAMTNADLGSSGLRTRAALTSPSFSTVGMNSASLTFQNLYQRWASGDSAVAVQVSTNGGTVWTNLKEYFAIGTDQGTVTSNAQVMANETIALGAGLMNQPDVRIRFYYVSSWGYYWMIDNVQLTGTPAPLTYAWTSSPAGYTSASQNPATPVSPAVTTTYTMTATNSFGCTASASTTVTVNQPSTSTTTVAACASYTWTNGVTYTTSGTHTQTLVNAVGCDSIATLNLTINALPTVNAGADQAVCTGGSVTLTGTGTATGYVWNNSVTNGVAFNPVSTLTYTVTGTDGNGCVNTDQVVVTVNNPTTGTDTQVACSSFTWINGVTYTTSNNTATHTLVGGNANGCDSIVTLNLTINQPTSSTVTATACGSYTWAENATTYTTSGSYPVVLAGANANGCDSTVTLVLTINQPTSSTVTAVACGSYTWAENGTTYTTSGSYPVVLAGANANGCDSTVTLVLTINQPTSSTVTASACGSYTWAENGTTYTTSGSYPVVLAGANANGCDSTITLNLTINNSTTGIDVQTACGTYTWIDGNTYTASNNTATFTIVGGAATGCDSIVTLNLTINAIPNATATDNGNATITASAGTSYQWVNCTTGLAVSGANAQTFAPSANGSYAVVVTNASGCSDTSSCVNINNVDVKELSSEYISVYPNPTHNNVTITMTAQEANVVVVDGAGKTLKIATIKNGDQISLEEFATGVYFLNITTEFGTQLVKVSKN